MCVRCELYGEVTAEKHAKEIKDQSEKREGSTNEDTLNIYLVYCKNTFII